MCKYSLKCVITLYFLNGAQKYYLPNTKLLRCTNCLEFGCTTLRNQIIFLIGLAQYGIAKQALIQALQDFDKLP